MHEAFFKFTFCVFELFQSYMQVALAIDEYIPYVPKDTSVVTDQE